MGKEVPATSSLSQVPVLPYPSQRKFPGFKQTEDEQHEDIMKMLNDFTVKPSAITRVYQPIDPYPSYQASSGYCPPRNTPFDATRRGYVPPTSFRADGSDRFSRRPELYANPPLTSIPEEPALSDGRPDATQTALQVMTEAVLKMDLPKRPQITFDGDPKRYRLFISTFKQNIESRISDPAARLSHLIEFCEGAAEQEIMTCAELPPDVGYPEALKRLREKYGESDIVARSYTDEMKTGPNTQGE